MVKSIHFDPNSKLISEKENHGNVCLNFIYNPHFCVRAYGKFLKDWHIVTLRNYWLIFDNKQTKWLYSSSTTNTRATKAYSDCHRWKIKCTCCHFPIVDMIRNIKQLCIHKIIHRYIGRTLVSIVGCSIYASLVI